MKKQGTLVVVSGFAGTGKGTVMKELLKRYDSYALSISATTRNPRGGEVDGREYFFKTKEEFEQMIEADEFVEYACYVGNYYGTPKKYVQAELRIVHYTLIKWCNHSAGIEAVAGRPILSHTHSDILRIRKDTALARTVFGKLRTGMTACRTDIQNRLDIRLHTVLLCDVYQRLEVNIDIILILRSSIVNKDLHVNNLRQMFLFSHITLKVSIGRIFNGFCLSVNTDYGMTAFQKLLRNCLTNAL